MDRFQEMQVFARIAERHSFSKAAEDLRIPPATVTNLIKRRNSAWARGCWSAPRARSA